MRGVMIWRKSTALGPSLAVSAALRAARPAVLVIGLTLVFVTAAAPASAAEQTIQVRGGAQVTAVGPWRPGPAATLPGATLALGPPARVRRSGRGTDCEARWPVHGLRVQFQSYGGDPCVVGFAGPVWMTGRSKWRTERQLTIGMSTEQLARRYPAAEPGRLFWIGSGRLLFPREEVCLGVCDGEETVTVSALWAKTRAGRVVGFFSHLGGPGE